MVVERTSKASLSFQNSAKNISFLLLIFIALIAKNAFADTSLFFKDNVDGSRTLTGHVPPEVAVSAIQYHADANEMLALQLILPIANQAQLDGVLKGIYDPQSQIYHHFLTSDQFNQQFKVSNTDLNAVKNYFSSQGFAINNQSPNGSVLYVTGSAAAVERAFRLHIYHYKKNDGTMFHASDTDPTISTEIVGKVSAVAGLDNLPNKFKPHVHQLTQKLANSQAASGKMTGTGPEGYLSPGDVKTAYNLNTIPSYSNSVQNVALFELDGYLQSDIAQYESYFNLPNNNSVILQNVLIDGFNGLPTYTGGNDEVTLDIEELIGIAPWAYNKIYVYEAGNTWQGWIDEWTKIANDNIATIISCSWGIAEYESPVIIFDSQIFQEMAVQGQEVFVASGDCGAYADCYTTTLSTDEPASQPYATGVGISALSVNSNGTYKSETASLYSGGGVSQNNPIPSYQQAMAALAAKNTASYVSTTMRNVPDVALTADPSTCYAFYITIAPQSGSTPPTVGWYGFWGSSIAAPTWAAFLAQVNQGRVHAGQTILGFLNPVIYQMAANVSPYATDFHDITTGNNQYYPAQAGLDDATGLGSFNGFNLYNDLVPNSLTIPPVPVGLQASGGISQVSLSWSASNTATSYNVKRSTVSGGGSQGYTTIASLVFNTAYTDTSVVNGTTYYYVVSAVNSAGQSANSSQASAEPVLPVPSAPVLSAAAGDTEVLLSWTAGTAAASYNVKRATGSAGPYTTIASGVTTTSYTDTSVSNGTTYYYVVAAVNASGSANSAYVSATPSATVAVVTNLTGVLSTYLGHPSIVLNWTQSSSLNIVSNNLYYSIGSASYVKLASLPATTTVTTIGEGPGETYNFYVTAVNSSGKESAMSNQVHVTTNGPPGAPTIGTATAGNTQATVNFTPPSSNGGFAITNYTVTVLPGGKTVNGKSSPIIVTGLTNGTAYTFSVTATNSAGTGTSSFSSNSVTPAGPPAAPTTVTAIAGNADAIVSFSGASANGSAITGYTVTASPGGKTVNGTLSPITVSNLTNGTAYTFTVTATNSVGTSAASVASKSVTPAGVPTAPTTVTALAGNADAIVSFSGASANGNTISSYTVTSSPGGKTAKGTSSPITVTGLTNGTAYTFTVTATNGVGTSTASVASKSVTPTGVPTPPTTVTAIAGNADAIVSFSGASAASTISSYTVTSSPGGKTAKGTSSPIIVTGLTNGTAYTFTVTATNSFGTSAVSVKSNSIKPSGQGISSFYSI